MENEAIGVNDIIQQIKHILVEEMQLNVIIEEIPDDYSLLEGGLALDSIVAVYHLSVRLSPKVVFPAHLRQGTQRQNVMTPGSGPQAVDSLRRDGNLRAA